MELTVDTKAETGRPPKSPVITKVRDKNILITREETDEFGEKRLRIDHNVLRRLLINDEIGNKPVAFISIIGVKRTGKSFILNYILRYLRNKGWENKNWMGDGTTKSDKDDIRYRKSIDRVTTGIRIYEEKFEVPINNGKTMIVMLMDTQGLFDFETPEQVNKTVLTLSTMLSSVQIFNVMKHIDAQHIQYLETCVDFAIEAAKRHENGYLKLQKLLFLIRDCPEDEDLGGFESTYTLQYGKGILEKILQSKKGGRQQLEIRKKIRTTFKAVDCFPLPYPGRKVETKNFQGMNEELDKEFIEAVKPFVEEIASPQNLVPKRSERSLLTSREILYTIVGCDNLFAKKMFAASAMIEKNVEGYYVSECEEAVSEYAKMLENQFEEALMNETGWKKVEKEISELAFRRYDTAAKLGSDAIRQKFRKDLEIKLKDHYNNFLNRVKCREQLEKSKLKTKTEEALVRYRHLMEIKVSEVNSMKSVEEIHDAVTKEISKQLGDSIDFNRFRKKSFDILRRHKSHYEKAIKESVNSKKNERDKTFFNLIHVKLRNKCEEMWKQKLSEYVSETDFNDFKLTVEGDIKKGFWSEVLSPEEYQYAQLLHMKLHRMKEVVRNEAGWSDLSEEVIVELRTAEGKKDYTRIVDDVAADFCECLRLEAKKFSTVCEEYEATERELTEDHGRKYFDLCHKELNPSADNLEDMLDNEYIKAKEVYQELWEQFKEHIATLVDAIVLDHEKYLHENMSDKHIKDGGLSRYYEAAIEEAKKRPPEKNESNFLTSETTKDYYEELLIERMAESLENNEKKNDESKEMRPIQESEYPTPRGLKKILKWFKFQNKYK